MSKFFFPIVRVCGDGKAAGLAGTAFPITPGGGLVTCRHVVDIVDDAGEVIPTAIVDGDRLVPILDPVYLPAPEFDMALLPSALGREHPHYFPMLPARRLWSAARSTQLGTTALAVRSSGDTFRAQS
jgi:hypothetical protein